MQKISGPIVLILVFLSNPLVVFAETCTWKLEANHASLEAVRESFNSYEEAEKRQNELAKLGYSSALGEVCTSS